MPLAYRDVLDQYSRSKAFGDPRDFQGFATDLEKLNPGQGYAQAASHDGWWTRASTALDRNVFEPVASYTTEPLGRAIGGLFGNEEAGAEFGRAIPRTLAETAPLYLLGPEAGVPATIAALAGTGALMGAHTYAETGSAKAALVSGAAGALLPGVGRVAGNIGARLAGGIRLTGDFAPEVAGVGGRGVFDQIVPEAAKDYAGVTAGRFAGSQLGMTAVNTASNLAQQRILNPDQSIDWEKEGVHSVISQIPWTVFDLVHTLRAPKTTAEQIRPLLRSPETKSTTETYVPPPSTPEQHAQLDAVLTQLQSVALSDTATPQEKEAALSAAISASADPKAVIDLKKQTSLPANEPVSIAGYARQHLGDNWKVLVDDVQSAKELGIEAGQTVWVNGAKPEYDQQSGQHIFKINSGQISKNVTIPLAHGDFGIVRDPNQPELPVQGKPFEGPLKPDQQRVLEKEGVVNPPTETHVELAPVADQIEQTHTQLAETKQKIDAVPQSAEEIPSLFHETVIRPAVRSEEGEIFVGHIHADAISHLERYNPKYKIWEHDEPSHPKEEQGFVTDAGRFVTFEEARQISGVRSSEDLGEREPAPLTEIELKGNVPWTLEQSGVKSPIERTKEAVAAGYNPTQAVEKVRLQTNTPEHDAALQQLNVLREQAKVISMTGKAKPQAQYGEAVRDENGQNFPTRALADAYKESDPDLSEHVVRDAGAGKGFYLAKQINKEVSLEGTDLDKVLPAHESVQEALDDPSTPPVTGRPDVSKEDVLRTLDQMAKQPKVADEILDNGGDLAQTLSELKTAREFLSANLRGEKPEVTPELMKTVAKVVKGSGLWNRAYRNFTLASDVPADPELVKKLNLQDGGANAVLDFFTGRQESGLHGEMMTALRKAVDFSGLKFTYNLRDGWTYSKDGTVNVPYMPSADTLDSWFSSFNHELTHHATRDLAERTDPAAMQFKATLSQGLEALKQSPAMPRQVRRVVGEFLSEFKKINDADAASFSDIQKNLIDKWRTKVGDKLDEWMHVVYGLQNHDELVSSMFESPQMVKLMQQTKMPKNLTQTVLQFFSKAWNSVFGGRAELDNIFGQVLQGFDNYLGVRKLPPQRFEATIGAPPTPALINVAGRKGQLLRNNVVGGIVKDFSKGHDVTDAFGGSGQLSEFVKSFGAKSVTTNIKDPEMHALFKEVKDNPEDFAKRVEAAVAPITSTREQSTPTVEGYDSIRTYLDELQKKDPIVALYIKQNLNAMGREVSKGSFTPSKVMATEGLRSLPNRIRSYSRILDNVSNEDAWGIIGRAKEGDRILVDPPYVGTKKGMYNETGNVTVENQLANYEKNLYPAAERGAKFVIFDVAHPELVKSLEDHGFVVSQTTRTARGKNDVQPELVAHNDPDVKSASQVIIPSLPDTPVLQTYNGRDYLRDSLLSNGVRPEQLASRMDSVERLFKTGDLTSVADAFEKEGQNGLLPTTANVGPVAPEVKTLLADGNPTDVREAVVNLLADQVPAHQELWNRMREDLNVTRDLVDNIKKGLVPGALPDGIEEKLRLAGVRLNGMKRGLERQARDLKVINYTNNFTYDGLETTIASQLVNPDLPNPPDPTGVQDIAHGLMGLADVRKETAQKELRGEDQIGFLTRTFMLTQHVKKLFPAFRPIADDVREHIGRAIERITTLNLAYAYDYNFKSFSKDIARSNSRVAQNETLTRVSSDIKRWANVQEAAGKEWKWTDDGVQQFLGKLNQKDQDAVKLEFDSERARHQVWTEQILPQALTKINQENTAKVIASFETGMLPDTARDLSQHIYDALALMQDPTQSVAGSEMLRQLGDKMQPNTLIAALKHAQGSVADVNKHLEFMRSRPSYVSEQRYDAHHLVMVGPDGQNFRASAKTKEDLMKIQAKQEAKGYTFLDYVPKADANVPAGGVSGDILDSMRELDVQSYNRLLDALKGVDPTIVAQVLPETQRTAQYEASTNAFKPVPNVTRRFVEGREYINMLENQHEFYVRANNWLRHRLTDTTTSLDMLHPDVAGNRTLKQFADQHVQNSLTPDNAFFRKLVEATYFQRLAFSLGNSLLESVQNLTTGMQAVISETGSVSDAFKYWFGAVNELRKTGFTNKWSNLDTQYLMDKAAHLGARGMAHWNDIIDPDRDTVFTVNQEKFGVVRNAADNIRYGARKWATFFQRYNDNIGLLAGFQLAREKGMDLDEAFNYAWDLKERGLYSGGKAQRPVGLWSIKIKPVPQMLSSLNTYTLGWFSQLATDWKIGFGGVAGDFTPTQRQGAKKAFLYGLSAQAVLAGALGLPGVGQGMALLKQATGIDLKGQLRGGLASLFGEDTENGGILTNLAMRGGLAATTPIDPSNRAAVAFPFLGIDPYKGFDLAQLMGAPGSTVSDAVQGLLAAAHGDFVGFQKLLPSVLKPSMGLLQGEGDVRDKRGTLLYNLSPAERFMTAVGLPPARIQQARDTAEAVKNLNDAATQRQQGLVDELATLTRKGRLQEVQQKLVESRMQNPELDLRTLVKSISGRVEAQTVPYDYRRNLNVAADLQGFGSRQPATEVQRLQLRQGVEESLGLWSKPNFKEDYHAQQIDELMNANPYLSRAGALRQTEGLRQALRRRSELYFPASQ